MKIGFTERTVEKRIGELESGTGVIPGYYCLYAMLCSNPHVLEQAIHSALKEFRTWKNKEFFRIDVIDAISTIKRLPRIDGCKVFEELTLKGLEKLVIKDAVCVREDNIQTQEEINKQAYRDNLTSIAQSNKLKVQKKRLNPAVRVSIVKETIFTSLPL